MAMGIADVRLESAEVEAQGPLAVEVGRYSLAGADGGTLDQGKYLVVWHRDDAGAWRLHRCAGFVDTRFGDRASDFRRGGAERRAGRDGG